MSVGNPSPETPPRPPSQPARLATTGKVRWRRFAILMVPAAAVAAVLVGLTATGSIAASISVSGSAFEVTSAQLRGTGFEQFGGIGWHGVGGGHGGSWRGCPWCWVVHGARRAAEGVERRHRFGSFRPCVR